MLLDVTFFQLTLHEIQLTFHEIQLTLHEIFLCLLYKFTYDILDI